jgi:hypothetical protein
MLLLLVLFDLVATITENAHCMDERVGYSSLVFYKQIGFKYIDFFFFLLLDIVFLCLSFVALSIAYLQTTGIGVNIFLILGLFICVISLSFTTFIVWRKLSNRRQFHKKRLTNPTKNRFLSFLRKDLICAGNKLPVCFDIIVMLFIVSGGLYIKMSNIFITIVIAFCTVAFVPDAFILDKQNKLLFDLLKIDASQHILYRLFVSGCVLFALILLYNSLYFILIAPITVENICFLLLIVLNGLVSQLSMTIICRKRYPVVSLSPLSALLAIPLSVPVVSLIVSVIIVRNNRVSLRRINA